MGHGRRLVVLDHDGLHRAGQPDQKLITEISRAELDVHIPTLDELYDACGTDFDLAIDIKGDDAGAAISRVAAARGVADRLWLFTPSTTRPGDIGGAHAGVTVRGEELQDAVRRRALAQPVERRRHRGGQRTLAVVAQVGS